MLTSQESCKITVGIRVMQFPTYIPDLNLIEHLLDDLFTLDFVPQTRSQILLLQ